MTCMISLTPALGLYALGSIDDPHRWMYVLYFSKKKTSIFQSNSDTTLVFMFYLWLVRDLPSFDARLIICFCWCCCSFQFNSRERRIETKKAYCIQLILLKIIKSNCLNALLYSDRAFTCYLWSIVSECECLYSFFFAFSPHEQCIFFLFNAIVVVAAAAASAWASLWN